MSEENLEALRRAAAAARKDDPSILDALLDPEVVWEVGSEDAIFDLVGTYRGIDEVRGFFVRFLEALAEWHWEHHDLEAVGDHVIARMHMRGRGRHSGIEMENDIWQLWTFRNGKVVRYRDCDDRAAALEAAGR
jgi:ketosteroid isomerase-like protein